jgi:hypothetical protein
MNGSFDRSSFMRDVDAMFVRVEGQINEIVEKWKSKVVEHLVIATPGPGNQWPTTAYIATGRLRAGWNFGVDPPAMTPLMGISGAEDGDDRAGATISKVGLQVSASGLLPVTYYWNEVGYALYVHEGLGNHAKIGPGRSRNGWR